MFAYLEGHKPGKELENQVNKYKKVLSHIGGLVQTIRNLFCVQLCYFGLF